MIRQSALLSFLKCIGMPRYLKRYFPDWQPKSCEYCCSISLARPKQNISLLWKLILRPDNCSKAHSNIFVLVAFSISWSMKRMVSSAYYKIDKPPSTRWGTTPVTWPSSLALIIRIANMSTTILNKMGESGSPCLRPFKVWKFYPIWSLILIPTWPLWMKASIHSHYFCEKPFILIVFWMKLHLTLSYAFSKLILKMTPLCFFLCNSWMVSCKTTTPSMIFRPGRKAVCVGLITFCATDNPISSHFCENFKANMKQTDGSVLLNFESFFTLW